MAFIALPPNATYLVQMLNVAYFRPVKGKWRKKSTRMEKYREKFYTNGKMPFLEVGTSQYQAINFLHY